MEIHSAQIEQDMRMRGVAKVLYQVVMAVNAIEGEADDNEDDDDAATLGDISYELQSAYESANRLDDY